MKRYVIIAGVNGSGKSTLYQLLDNIKDMERVNTDEIVRSFGDWRVGADVVKAGKIAVNKINEFFDRGISFNQETTLCGRSILKNIDKAKKLGYRIELHYIGVNSVDIAKSRIAYRVEHGGHGIPDKDVERRYYESFEQLKNVMDKCDMIVLYDNTEAFSRFAIITNDGSILSDDKVPKWYKDYVEEK